MLKDRSHDKTVHRSLYATSSAGKGGTLDIGERYTEKLHACHSRPMRAATNGLVGFDADGEIRLAVDPSKYAVMALCPQHGYSEDDKDSDNQMRQDP